MAIRAVVFDIGGVLEITPDLGLDKKWEEILGLGPGELNKHLHEVWKGGSIGTISEEQVYDSFSNIPGMSDAQRTEFIDDIWQEYLGTLNVDLFEYFKALRPKYQTAILSNSFVGAREKEQRAYGFEESCDFIIYSHEVGMSKPDPRIYQLVCTRLGLPPEDVIFVDDHDDILEPARALGMHGILFKDNAQVIAEMEKRLKKP